MNDAPPPVVLLHGFGQNRRCWGQLASTLADQTASDPTAHDPTPTAHDPTRIAHDPTPTTPDVTALDLPGHGAAGAIEADLWTTADLVAEAIDPSTPAVVIGYSFGGRVALHTALAYPDRVAGLVLISATAGIDDDTERESRRRADERLADHIEEIGVDAFVDEWLALPLFAGLPESGRYVDERRTNHARGLATSLRLAGTGTQEPLWGRLAELTMPVLVLVGEHDTKFRDLGERMAESIGPSATFVVVGSAGHTVHLEQPGMVADLVVAWLGQM